MGWDWNGKSYDMDWNEIDAMGNRIGNGKDWAANASHSAATGMQNPYTNLPGASIMDGSGAIPGNQPGSTLAPVGPGGWQAGVLGGSGAGGATAAGTAPAAGTAGAAPVFNAPVWDKPADFAYDKQFVAPTADDLYKDPSYQFRLDQGRKALEQSAAGKGLLRSGGTLKDVLNYGQNAASQEYGNVYNRMFGEYKFDYDKAADIYDINYKGSHDKFDADYKGAYDTYQPRLTEWQTNTNNNARRWETEYQGGITTSEGEKNRAARKAEFDKTNDLNIRRVEQGDWS